MASLARTASGQPGFSLSEPTTEHNHGDKEPDNHDTSHADIELPWNSLFDPLVYPPAYHKADIESEGGGVMERYPEKSRPFILCPEEETYKSFQGHQNPTELIYDIELRIVITNARRKSQIVLAPQISALRVHKGLK
ncbi:uncharacterized protein BCR38DRAFT_407145 [Pseudomassariella vexata]|uniref:Uncharacterized protein n=1 Tax=Pseudomassariella vexata TaxID=1141098 RepID=A0A1Y2E8E9_9PEZI|nr:uncharacterized protein BCR38DRAFT_407145 [Pseudomassariella vexata]ORY67135.1 hypothetical protein BCR38DRAFT_407145 [Pseudomassariella vexata]